MPAPLISLRGITRRFAAVVANDDVSLELEPGCIHALVGENGAGKTTLMRVLYGLLQPDAGRIEVDGRAVRIANPAAAMRLGLGMVHQHFLLVEPLTVAENVTLAREPGGALGAFSRDRARRDVRALAERYRLPVDPSAVIRTLSVGAQQRVEILKALYHGARVLILDEPTAVLTPQEVEELFVVLRELQAQGATIVLITHKLAEVRAIADRVTVMRAGRVVGGGPIASLSTEAISDLMVGHSIPALGPRAPRATGRPLLEVSGLAVFDDLRLEAVRGVTFEVRSGEIVGIAGVEGNGQHELIEALAGLRAPARGRIVLHGHPVTGHSARTRFDAGLAHIPADRLRRGLVPGMTLSENLVLGLQRRIAPDAWLAPRALERRALPLLLEHDVRPPDPRACAAQLSGGNQQKLIVARELSRGAGVVLASHPTRGVDLGAVAAIHHRLLAERDAGRAVLLVSSELSEILALSDRILVMFGGALVHEARPESTDERTLGLYMTGRPHATPNATR